MRASAMCLFPALLLAGCSRAPSSSSGASSVERRADLPSTASSAPPPSRPGTPPQVTSAPSASAPATPPSGQPLPPFASLKKMLLRREQGGPSIKRCGGVEYEVEIDLVAGTWQTRLCHPDTKGAAGSEPLTRTQGKLTAARSTELARAYQQLRHEPARGCGKDGGTLSLSVTDRGGKTERWVDQNWGCVQPPPESIDRLDEFRVLLMSLAAPDG